MISNTPIPFLHPHTDPYKYLGVVIIPNFNASRHGTDEQDQWCTPKRSVHRCNWQDY